MKQPLKKIPVLYQDQALLAINKPARVYAQPGSAGQDVLSLLKEQLPEQRCYLVHRLDRDTSGVMILVKDKALVDVFKKMFQGKKIKKSYLALVDGQLSPKAGELQSFLAHQGDGRWQSVDPQTPGAKEAITRYEVKEWFDSASLVELQPVTGRTHQIRVHCAELGHPVLGDQIYAAQFQSDLKIKRHFLHCAEISFKHPKSVKDLSVKAPLTEDLTNAIEQCQS